MGEQSRLSTWPDVNVLRFINFYNLPSISVSLHLIISDILRSQTFKLEALKLLEAHDPATQFEIAEDGDIRIHLYEKPQT
jgi:hypothetical protein